jgi:hypothetical protein
MSGREGQGLKWPFTRLHVGETQFLKGMTYLQGHTALAKIMKRRPEHASKKFNITETTSGVIVERTE